MKQGAFAKKQKLLRQTAAYFTVEAALVVPVVLLSLAFVMREGLRIHDAVTGTAVLNEALELYTHLPKEAWEQETGTLQAYASGRLEHMLSQNRFQIVFSFEEKSASGTVSGREYQAELRERRFEPEQLMRKLTLLEALAD